MVRLSAFLITKNESRDIGACLDSLKGLADEIIVVDSGSTDDTMAICQARGAKVLSHPFEGFAAQKQFALEQTTGDWAISIDADERVTPDLAKEIQYVMNNAREVGFQIQRNMYFLGHRLRYGGVGTDWPLRLFRRTLGKFVPVRVHERIAVQGAVGQLGGPLEHYSYSSIREYVDKANHYTTLAAQDLYAKGRRFSRFDHLRPSWELFNRVVLRGAWLDGRPGLIYAALSAHTAWLRNVKLWELEKS